MKKYLLDSNVFIQAHRMHYPFDVVPSFWNKLKDLSDKEVIISIDKVKKELCYSSPPDVLASWCLEELNSEFFEDSSVCVDVYSEIANWANSNQQFSQNAKDEFLATDLADPWLIAFAKKQDCIIVTHEKSQPGIKHKIKIPEVCAYFSIRYISPIQMFRDLGETF
ncbi:MAG: DUF4411 family protein [Flavobacteriaceae bacterium]|nr:DUF4411 family protein [Flavobacteriaceae bacterium]